MLTGESHLEASTFLTVQHVGCCDVAGAQVGDGVWFVLSIYLAVLGLFVAVQRLSLGCRERGCSAAAVRELVTAVASLVQHGL